LREKPSLRGWAFCFSGAEANREVFALHTAEAAVCRNPKFPLRAQVYSASIGKLIGDKS
jgi:hypothetical protein